MNTREANTVGRCAWCERPAHIKQGRINLCGVHYRLSSMRARARRDGKRVPSWRELVSLIPTPFVCAGCNRAMNWLRDYGASTQVTLQHDRSGAVRMLCLGCNTRHAHHPEDTFYDIPEGHKRCARCDTVKPVDDFSRDRSRPCGRKGHCKKCSHEQHTKWRLENREHYNAKQRENRASRNVPN